MVDQDCGAELGEVHADRGMIPDDCARMRRVRSHATRHPRRRRCCDRRLTDLSRGGGLGGVGALSTEVENRMVLRVHSRRLAARPFVMPCCAYARCSTGPSRQPTSRRHRRTFER